MKRLTFFQKCKGKLAFQQHFKWNKNQFKSCGLSPCPHTVSGGYPKTFDGVAAVRGSRTTLHRGLGRTSSSGPDTEALPRVWRKGLGICGSGRVWIQCPGANWSLVDCHQVLSSGQFDRKSWCILTAGGWYSSH